jgi:hypothetical protein
LNLIAETHSLFGPRFYLNPSYSFGDFTVAGRLKLILSNGYDTTNIYYDGGGFLGGIEPFYSFKLDGTSDLKFSASFDYVSLNPTIANGGLDPNNPSNQANPIFNLWTFGATYEVKL